MKRLDEINTKIKELEQAGGVLLAEKRHLEGWTPEQRLADELFEALCHNKRDTNWYYEIKDGIHDWSLNDHAHWGKKARRAIYTLTQSSGVKDEGVAAATIETVIKAIIK